jgi:phosphoribosylanthranilate isomerase
MMVKSCGITNREDAAAAIEAGAAAIGMIFFPKSPRYITPEQAWEIAQAIPRSVLKVGVFVNETPRAIDRVAATVGLDVAQLHGQESPSRLPKTLRVWKAFQVSPSWSPATMDGFSAEAFLLDSPVHGTEFDWSLVRNLRGRIVLAGGLDASNVQEAIRSVRPWGVDACSRLEIKPGIKDHQKVRQFVKAALMESAG